MVEPPLGVDMTQNTIKDTMEEIQNPKLRALKKSRYVTCKDSYFLCKGFITLNPYNAHKPRGRDTARRVLYFSQHAPIHQYTFKNSPYFASLKDFRSNLKLQITNKHQWCIYGVNTSKMFTK